MIFYEMEENTSESPKILPNLTVWVAILVYNSDFKCYILKNCQFFKV